LPPGLWEGGEEFIAYYSYERNNEDIRTGAFATIERDGTVVLGYNCNGQPIGPTKTYTSEGGIKIETEY